MSSDLCKNDRHRFADMDRKIEIINFCWHSGHLIMVLYYDIMLSLSKFDGLNSENGDDLQSENQFRLKTRPSAVKDIASLSKRPDFHNCFSS